MPTLLIVDDCAITRRVLARLFVGPEMNVIEASSSEDCLQAISEHEPDVVILDIVLPDASGLETFRRIRDSDARLPVIMITSTRSSESVIEAMKLGAMDFLSKPVDEDLVIKLVLRAIESRRQMRVPVNIGTTDIVEGNDAVVGCSPAMQDVYKAIGLVAQHDLTVLIRGESGTGKELVARAIYQHSKRVEQPFLAINCAAIPEALLESELFGHEKGAFTGADHQRVGRFEQCCGGTLFLDEIGDMTPFMQSKLLRVLQDQTFQRVGGNDEIQSDVRIVAATSRNLEDMVGEGQFRSDLYYRLRVVEIKLPALRDRLDDLPILIGHFLTRYGRELQRDYESISSEAVDSLMQYEWPGNIRELQSILKQALLRATGPVILQEFLPAAFQASQPCSTAEDADVLDLNRLISEQEVHGTQSLYADTIELVERALLKRVLGHTSGNQRKAAELLGITRNTLRSKMKLLGIATTTKVVQDEPAFA